MRLLAVLCIGLLCLGRIHGRSETVLNAAIMGRKGQVNTEDYEMIAEALAGDEESFCRIEFTALEYDTSNGSAVFNSLKHARKSFENETMAVAIGPQINVFTSTDYVILHQIHLVTSADDVIQQASRTMPILPDPKSLSTAIAKFAKYLEWRKLAFLSQDDFSPVLALGGEGIFVSPIRLPSRIDSSDNPQLKQTLTTLRESQMDKFILHSMKKDVVKTVIEAARRLHLLHHSIQWLITYLDIEDIASEIKEMATLYGLRLLDPQKVPKHVQDIFNGTISRLDIGLMVDVVGILRHYLNVHVQDCSKEPATNSSMTSEDFKRVIKNAVEPYQGALGDYTWPKTGQVETSNIRKDYAIPIYRYLDKLEQVAQIIILKNEIKVHYFGDVTRPPAEDVFKAKYFEVIAKQDEPFVMRRPNGEYYGFCVDVLNELSRKLNNFGFDIFELDHKDVKTNGKGRIWDDIITQLKVGNASIAVGAFAVTAEREEKIAFSYTIISSHVSLLLKRPPDTRNFFQFLLPFSTELWIMIVVFFLVLGICLYLMSRFDSTQTTAEQKFDLKESMWYSLNVLLQGSTEYSPQTTCMRTIVAFFWFCTLVITAAYTANLAAFLTLQQIDNRIKSVDHLARQTITKYGVLNNSDLMHFFENSREDPFERMWTFMKLDEQSSLLPNRSVGLERVMGPKPFAYLDDGVINNYISMSNCETESIEQNFGIKHFSMGFPKGAPYRDDINRALLGLKEDGTLDKLRDKWWSSTMNCTVDRSRSSTKVKTASELDLTNMFGVFIVLISSTVLSVLYEIGATIYKYFREKQKKKEQSEMKEDMNSIPPFQYGLEKQSTIDSQGSRLPRQGTVDSQSSRFPRQSTIDSQVSRLPRQGTIDSQASRLQKQNTLDSLASRNLE